MTSSSRLSIENASNLSSISLESLSSNLSDHQDVSPTRSQGSSSNNLHHPPPHQLTHPHEVFDSGKIQPQTSAGVATVASSQSRRSLVGLDPALQVPKAKRRGLLPSLSIVPEYENLRLYPSKIKYLIVFVVACCSILGPMGTSIIMPVINDVTSDLHTTASVVNVSVGIYLLSLGFFPLYWSSYSEAFGRRSIYVVSFIMFVCFSIGCAFSNNIAALIVLRVLCGASLASVQSVGAGTIGDLYPPQERGRAMGIYYLGPLGGPLFLPIIGGILGDVWGWRSTQWFLVIFGGCCCLLIIFLFPETLRKEDNREAIKKILRLRMRKPSDVESKSLSSEGDEEEEEEEENQEEEIQRIVSHQSVRSIQRSLYLDDEEENATRHINVIDSHLPSVSRVLTRQNSEILERLKERDLARLQSKVEELENEPKGERTKWAKFKKDAYFFLIKPLKSVYFLRYPPVLLSVSFALPLFACTYFVNLTLPYLYSNEPYNFLTILVGLVYIPNSVAYIIASIWGGKWSDKLLRDYANRHNGELAAEARIGVNVFLGAALMPALLLIFGWCADKKEQWVTPLIGTFVFGFANMIVIGATVTYLVDSLPGRGATGVALNNLMRMTLATIGCFINDPLIQALGIGVLFSILAGICVAVTVILVVLKKKGTYWRQTYDLLELYDLLD